MAVMVCRTCPRDTAQSGSYAAEVAKIFQTQSDSSRVIYVNCLGTCKQLGACKRGGALALDCVGMARVRFSGISPENAAAIRESHSSYENSATGHPSEWEVPEQLVSAITAVTPKRSARPKS